MTNPIDFSTEFPVVQKYTYLNTAASGLLPKSVAEWRHEHDSAFVAQASLFRDNHKELIWDVKREIAHFFEAEKERIALVPNFSFGLNVLLEGIPKGKRVLLLERDYPSINWPVEYRDFEVRHVPINEHLEATLSMVFEEFRPDFFLCSLVQYINGIRIDLEALSDLKSRFPETVFIGDGTQSFGAWPCSFKKGPFDVVGASTYKWLLGGYGCGFMILREGIEEYIAPKVIGFNSADAVYGNKEAINLIGRLEPGHQDTLNFGSLQKSLQLLSNIGIERIESKVLQLSKFAFERFSELGWLEPSVRKRPLHSSIYNIPGNRDLFLKLKSNGIITSQRGKGLRVSFHFYNSEEDVEKLIAAIQAEKA